MQSKLSITLCLECLIPYARKEASVSAILESILEMMNKNQEKSRKNEKKAIWMNFQNFLTLISLTAI